MAQSRSKPATRRSSGSGGRLFLGILLGIAIGVAGVFAWLHFTSVPIKLFGSGGARDTRTLHVPITSRMASIAQSAPFGPSEDVFENAAHTYRAKCAQCHGAWHHSSSTGIAMTPPAKQFWVEKGDTTLRDLTSREVYDRILQGEHESGMPAFANSLSDTQIWQLSLLLKSSDLELPDPVVKILK